MQFNEVAFRVKLESILFKHSLNKGLSIRSMNEFRDEVYTTVGNEFGLMSIVILPFCQRPENIWKIRIYFTPDKNRYNYQY